jgi:hypothetical protein
MKFVIADVAGGRPRLAVFPPLHERGEVGLDELVVLG